MKTPLRQIGMGLMLLLFLPGLQGQKTGISLSAGLASQRMDDMKYLQEYILSTYPLEGKITSSFPPFTTFSVNLVKEWYSYLHYGGGYTFSTTGGKSSYSDPTGNIATEMDATAHRLGAFVSYTILEREPLELALHGRMDVNVSSVNIESAINVLGLINRIYNQYRSIGPSVSAGLELMYNFEAFSLGLDAGYQIDIPGNLKETDDDGELTDPNDSNRVLRADWTGWHAGIKARVWLGL